MTPDNEQIARKACQIAEDKDAEGRATAFADDGVREDAPPGRAMGMTTEQLLDSVAMAVLLADMEMLGTDELRTARVEETERHPEGGIALARRIGLPFLEFIALAHQAAAELHRSSFPRPLERGGQSVELAGQHGWTDEPAVGTKPAVPSAGVQPPVDPLTRSEIRVLRYLPSLLSAREIADQLYVSTSTVRTHMRTLYAKLGAHRRREAVERARALGLLAPSPLRGQATLPR